MAHIILLSRLIATAFIKCAFCQFLFSFMEAECWRYLTPWTKTLWRVFQLIFIKTDTFLWFHSSPICQQDVAISTSCQVLALFTRQVRLWRWWYIIWVYISTLVIIFNIRWWARRRWISIILLFLLNYSLNIFKICGSFYWLWLAYNLLRLEIKFVLIHFLHTWSRSEVTETTWTFFIVTCFSYRLLSKKLSDMALTRW